MAMTMAKSPPDEVEAVNQFVADLEAAVEHGEYRRPGQDIDDEQPEEDRSDERLGRFVREFWGRHPGALFRVAFGYQVLIDNCCDPNAGLLEWRPDVEAILNAAGWKAGAHGK